MLPLPTVRQHPDPPPPQNPCHWKHPPDWSRADPTSQTEFQEQVVNNITEIVPGHQCYKIDDIPSSIKAGTNATIQLQYWSVYEGENNNQNQTFYACADIVSAPFPPTGPCRHPRPAYSTSR